MLSDPLLVAKRERSALNAIRRAYGRETDDYGVTLFVIHHLQSINPKYWQKHVGSTEPEPYVVLGILILKSHWIDTDDGSDVFDFTLPGDVTDYVLSVRFDEKGEIEEIAMES